jgi:hypothetical protein
MERETKIFFITVAVALGILWLTKPKLNSEGSSSKDLLDVKYKAPSVASVKDTKAKEDAVVGMQAMKDAIASKESKTELNKLNSIIFQDYGVKIMVNKKNGKLRAMSKDGKVVAEEQ